MKTKKNTQESTLKLLVEVEQFTSKKGLVCYKGIDKDGNKFVGFTNTTKKNEKEPDIRFNIDEDEVFALWKRESKKGNIYLSGLTNEKEQLVAFIDEDTNHLRVYYSLSK